MNRYKEWVTCVNGKCAQSFAVEFTEATRKLRLACPSCGQLNQIEIILPTDKGGPADLYGKPGSGEKVKIVVVPAD
jgi:hypothetical protein